MHAGQKLAKFLTDQEVVLRRFFIMGQAYDPDASTFGAIEAGLQHVIEAPVNERSIALLGWLVGWMTQPFPQPDRLEMFERVVNNVLFPFTRKGGGT